MDLPVRITNVNIALGGLAVSLFFILFSRWTRIPKGAHLPPGPPGKAIFGNVSDMPKTHEWETYTQWAKKYGDLVYVKVLRQPIVLINSIAVAQELFEKRSAIYSDRFEFPMLIELMGYDWNFSLLGYGEKWRRHRKAFHEGFNPSAITVYQPVQIRRTLELLLQLHKSPTDFLDHLKHFSGAILMEITYGIKILPSDDPYVKIAESALEIGSNAANPGTFLVDTLPILKYLPEWMPGAGFKKQARIWKRLTMQMPIVPFETCKKAMREGTATPSMTASLLESMTQRHVDDVKQEESTIRNVGATTYAGGATTNVALSWFLLAMVLYPDVQRKAQAELDKVVGADRLPDFDDRKKLPYLSALCKEILRWRPVTPLAVSHRLMQDDVYESNFIPKGTIVVGNSWAMLHDEEVYGPNPEQFDPGRFLRPGAVDPSPAFGFGRRVCPGRHLADNTIYLAACSILHIFNISRAKDANGTEIPINVTSTSGAIMSPEPFKCSITPRITSAESLLDRYQDLYRDEL